jgi:hypothetical protein
LRPFRGRPLPCSRRGTGICIAALPWHTLCNFPSNEKRGLLTADNESAGAGGRIRTSRFAREVIAGEEDIMGLLLLILLIVLLLGAAPAWPHSRAWGYGPSGVVGLLLVILLVALVLGWLPWGYGPY